MGESRWLVPPQPDFISRCRDEYLRVHVGPHYVASGPGDPRASILSRDVRVDAVEDPELRAIVEAEASSRRTRDRVARANGRQFALAALYRSRDAIAPAMMEAPGFMRAGEAGDAATAEQMLRVPQGFHIAYIKALRAGRNPDVDAVQIHCFGVTSLVMIDDIVEDVRRDDEDTHLMAGSPARLRPPHEIAFHVVSLGGSFPNVSYAELTLTRSGEPFTYRTIESASIVRRKTRTTPTPRPRARRARSRARRSPSARSSGTSVATGADPPGTPPGDEPAPDDEPDEPPLIAARRLAS